ncbi:peptidase family C78-domain-containing protein [Pyronema domesticum]|nr:peptidase family C78-domain-containing protein [Pyronema domesticum]
MPPPSDKRSSSKMRRSDSTRRRSPSRKRSESKPRRSESKVRRSEQTEWTEKAERAASKLADGLRRSDSRREKDGSRRSGEDKLRRSESRKHRISSSEDTPPSKVKRSSSRRGEAIGAIKQLGERATTSAEKDAARKKKNSDLGPYANEAQMPDWLRVQLERGGKTISVKKYDPETGRMVNEVQIANETPDLIHTIALLSEKDPDVSRTYLCDRSVKHVGKQITKEGGFCGYRNIQMMISFIQANHPRGSHPFDGRIPTILKLQELIEKGWAKGINSSARQETGGIYGTRKYIGTSEAQTLLTTVGIKSRARAFVATPKIKNSAQSALLDFVEDYFRGGLISEVSKKTVMGTNLAPIYLQHAGHSMTIIGLEKWRDGSRSLLVFDPFFAPTTEMRDMAGYQKISSRMSPNPHLKVYRRKMKYLEKFNEFEIIVLV